MSAVEDSLETQARIGALRCEGGPHSPTGHLLRQLADEIERLRAELEREMMRVVACGAVAMADTPESAAKARQMHDDYRSPSCDDVARRVDECIRLRAEIATVTAQRDGADATCSLGANMIRLLRAELSRLRAELAGLESVRREQAAGRDYWAKECDRLRAELKLDGAAWSRDQQRLKDAESKNARLRALLREVQDEWYRLTSYSDLKARIDAALGKVGSNG